MRKRRRYSKRKSNAGDQPCKDSDVQTSNSDQSKTEPDSDMIVDDTRWVVTTSSETDNFTKLSLEIICHILRFLSLRDVMRMDSMSKKIHEAVSLHLRVAKKLDFSEADLFGWISEELTDARLEKFLRRCPDLQYIYGFHPIFVSKRRQRGTTMLSVPGIIEALSLCKHLKGVELSDILILEAILNYLPRIEILGTFKNRNGSFPVNDMCTLSLTENCKITSLHLVGIVVPELPIMQHVKHLQLRWVSFKGSHPFRDFSAVKLQTFVMAHCCGPVSALKYVPLITSLAEARYLTRLELIRVPFLGGLIQHVVQDSWHMCAFWMLRSVKLGACKHALEMDIGFLTITAAKRIEEVCIQPSLTKDSLFVALKMAEVTFAMFETLYLGFVDSFPEPGTWTNEELVREGLTDITESPALITDIGMKAVGNCFPTLKHLDIYNCPHILRPSTWFTQGTPSWDKLTDLTLRRCHAIKLKDFCDFISQLPSLQSLHLEQMFREPPKGCSRVGLSAGTGMGMSSSVLNQHYQQAANQDAQNNNNVNNDENANQNEDSNDEQQDADENMEEEEEEEIDEENSANQNNDEMEEEQIVNDDIENLTNQNDRDNGEEGMVSCSDHDMKEDSDVVKGEIISGAGGNLCSKSDSDVVKGEIISGAGSNLCSKSDSDAVKGEIISGAGSNLCSKSDSDAVKGEIISGAGGNLCSKSDSDVVKGEIISGAGGNLCSKSDSKDYDDKIKDDDNDDSDNDLIENNYDVTDDGDDEDEDDTELSDREMHQEQIKICDINDEMNSSYIPNSEKTCFVHNSAQTEILANKKMDHCREEKKTNRTQNVDMTKCKEQNPSNSCEYWKASSAVDMDITKNHGLKVTKNRIDGASYSTRSTNYSKEKTFGYNCAESAISHDVHYSESAEEFTEVPMETVVIHPGRTIKSEPRACASLIVIEDDPMEEDDEDDQIDDDVISGNGDTMRNDIEYDKKEHDNIDRQRIVSKSKFVQSSCSVSYCKMTKLSSSECSDDDKDNKINRGSCDITQNSALTQEKSHLDDNKCTKGWIEIETRNEKDMIVDKSLSVSSSVETKNNCDKQGEVIVKQREVTGISAPSVSSSSFSSVATDVCISSRVKEESADIKRNEDLDHTGCKMTNKTQSGEIIEGCSLEKETDKGIPHSDKNSGTENSRGTDNKWKSSEDLPCQKCRHLRTGANKNKKSCSCDTVESGKYKPLDVSKRRGKSLTGAKKGLVKKLKHSSDSDLCTSSALTPTDVNTTKTSESSVTESVKSVDADEDYEMRTDHSNVKSEKNMAYSYDDDKHVTDSDETEKRGKSLCGKKKGLVIKTSEKNMDEIKSEMEVPAESEMNGNRDDVNVQPELCDQSCVARTEEIRQTMAKVDNVKVKYGKSAKSSKGRRRPKVQPYSGPKSNMCDQSTSTSDPVIEDDHVQILKINSKTLLSVSLNVVGITSLVFEDCPQLSKISGHACRVLKKVKIGNSPKLKKVEFTHCKKLDDEMVAQQVASQGPERNKVVYLRPLHQIDFTSLERKLFSDSDINHHICVVYDYNELACNSHYNRLRVVTWGDIFTGLNIELLELYNFPTWSKGRWRQKYPWGRGVYRMQGRNGNGSKWDLITDIPWLRPLSECPRLSEENIHRLDHIPGLYCPNTKGHFGVTQCLEDLTEEIAEQKAAGAYVLSHTCIVYINLCDVSGKPCYDPDFS